MTRVTRNSYSWSLDFMFDDDDDDDDGLFRVYVTKTLKQLFDDDDDSLLRVYVTRTLKNSV